MTSSICHTKPKAIQGFRFRAIDLLNLKLVSWNHPNRFIWFTTAIQDGVVNRNESL